MSKRSPARLACARLRKAALAYPEAIEDFPWGEAVYKVRGRIFLFLGVDEDGLGVTAKLRQTSGIALMLPNVEPTGYNLGRSGWVSARFAPDEQPKLSMLEAWIDESYRAVAPRRLVARLDAARRASGEATPAGPPAGSRRRRRRKVARRPPGDE